jgi:hypothetical protein
MRALTILAPLAACVLAAGCGGHDTSGRAASGAASPAGSAADAGSTAAGAFTAEVAAVDAKGSAVTLRNASASGAGSTSGERTVRVAGAAAGALASLKPGDQVVVGCAESGAAAPSGAGPGGSDMGTGPGGDAALSSCATVTSLTRVASK